MLPWTCGCSGKLGEMVPQADHLPSATRCGGAMCDKHDKRWLGGRLGIFFDVNIVSSLYGQPHGTAGMDAD